MLVLALWVALASAMMWDQDSERDAAEERAAALSDLLAAHTTRVLRQADQLAWMVTQEVLKSGPNIALVPYVQAKAVQLGLFLQVAVIDQRGILRASTVPGFKPVDLSDRPHFRAHVNAPASGLYISEPLIGRASGKPSIQLSKRIEDSEGDFLGVVVVSLDPAYLIQLFDQLRVGEHGQVLVFGARDFIIRAERSYPDSHFGAKIPLTSALGRAFAASSTAGNFRGPSFVDGTTQAIAFRSIKDYPLAVAVGLSEPEYLAGYRARRTFLLIVGILMTALILYARAKQTALMDSMLGATLAANAARDREMGKAERIDALFQAIPYPAMGFDRGGCVDGLNSHALLLLEASRAELIGTRIESVAKTLFRHDGSLDRTSKVQSLCEALQGEEKQTLIFPIADQTTVVYEIQVDSRRDGGTLLLIRDITSHADLQESERDLHITLHAISDAVISTDAVGNVKRINGMASQLIGLGWGEAVGRQVTEVLRLTCADDGGTFVDPVSEVSRTGLPLNRSDLTLHGAARGTPVDIILGAAPLRNDAGVFQGTVLVMRDVSVERAAEKALQASEDRYRRLIEFLPYAVIVQRNDKICYANPMAVSMLRASSVDALLDRNILELVHCTDRDLVKSRISLLRKQRISVPTTAERWIRLDGSLLECEVTAVPYDWDGESSALVLLQDISARRMAETQRDRFFELSIDLQCIASEDGYLKRVNRAFTQVLGWTSDEIARQPYINFVHPEDRPRTFEIVASSNVGVLAEHFENRYVCKDGTYRWLAWNAVREPDGYIYAIARDVTDIRAARDQMLLAKAEAESASRAKSAFLATMSHEIRTPMNGVVGMIEVLSRSGLSENQSDIASTIRQSAATLLRLIDDILDFSKIEAGRMEIESNPVSPRQVVEGVYLALLPVANAADVSLHCGVSDNVAEWVLADETRLRQVLYNLVGNAIKFSTGRPTVAGSVEISVDVIGASEGEPAAQTITFSVTDNGIGIAGDAIPHLFEPFTQAEASTTRRYGGTGLGLAICQRLVRAMGGQISVTSEVGIGSAFSAMLSFPIAPAAAKRDEMTAKHHRTSAAESSKILVVEDDPINQKVICAQLELLGYQAKLVNNGAEAIEEWRRSHYGLILTDIHMPIMDGYALVGAIRDAEGNGGETPIVALTANAMLGEKQRALAAGMDDYLTKPLHLNSLKAALERWLKPASRGAVLTQEEQRGYDRSMNVSVLHEMIGDDPQVVSELLSAYAEQLREMQPRLHQALRNDNRNEASYLSHRLKSSSRSVGALSLGELCTQIERACKEDLDLGELLASFEDEALRVTHALSTLQHEIQASIAIAEGRNLQ
ncbi:PAS domain S-box protein [Cupriavidus sp. U2]|nr:PAS domain S-box protein [Cupriavidus sp. U2]